MILDIRNLISYIIRNVSASVYKINYQPQCLAIYNPHKMNKNNDLLMGFKRKHVVNGCFISVFISTFCLQRKILFLKPNALVHSFRRDKTVKEFVRNFCGKISRNR